MANSNAELFPEERTELDEPVQHHEAAWVAFCNDVVIGGRRWNITLRQGLGEPEIGLMLQRILQANQLIDPHVDQLPREPVPDTERSRPPLDSNRPASVQGKPTEGPSGGNEEPRLLKAARIKVIPSTGDNMHPVVEIYSANEKLKFPELKPTADIVINTLERRYGEGSLGTFQEQLQQYGFVKPVDWDVYWTPSPKNPKWKDLLDIVVPAIEARREQ